MTDWFMREIQTVLDFGVHHERNANNNKIRTLNVIALVASFFSFSLLGVYTLLDYDAFYVVVWSNACFGFLYLVALNFNRLGYFKICRFICLAGGLIQLSVGCLVFGREAGTHYIFFGLLAISFITFDVKEIVGKVVLSALCIAMVFLGDFQFAHGIAEPYTPWMADFFLASSIILTFSLIIVAITTFLTEMLAANARLVSVLEVSKEKEAKLQEIFENSPIAIGISISDQSTDEGIIQYANPRFMDMTGMNRDKIGVARTSLFLPEGEAREKSDTALEDQGHLLNHEIELLRTDGSEFWALLSVAPIDFDERKSALFWIYDISEQKNAEEQLRQARDAAEDATKAKASFLAQMSHEIRTPMGGVIGMIDLLQQTKLDDDQQHMTSTVRNSANSLLTIINDILDFSKIEAGKLDLEEVPISIRDAAEGVGEALAVNARNKNIGLSVFVDPDIPDAVLGDQVRVRQILFNLGGNAIKFTDTGKVLIRADRQPSDDENLATIRFSIIDDGIGIPEDAQANLFTAFSQVEASTTRRFGGTGLGLSICQRLTELMAGEIGVNSEPGVGSTFHVTITFPVTDVPSIKSDGLDLGCLNILLAIEDDDMRELTPRYLERWGAKVETISDLGELEETALATPFDIIGLVSRLPMAAQVEMVEHLNSMPDLASKRFVIACAGRDRSERKAIENTIYIDTEPLIREKLIRIIAAAAGRISADIVYEEDDTPVRKVKAPTVAEAQATGQLVLFAEDNLTNQDVIGRQLNLLGYAFEVANNGKEALDMFQAKSYAILLTDCHMPVMDGFDLTRAIRELEKDKEGRFPIVAITASVMKEEIDSCFAAGMDDYLPKPLEMPKLSDMLRKRMPSEVEVVRSNLRNESPVEENTDSLAHQGPIDPSVLKNTFGDDEETFKEILADFIDPATDNVREIQTSFDEHLADGVAKAAHKLKSSARSVGATELADICQALEVAGNAGDWDEINKSAPRLSGILQKITSYIKAL
jgi:PAS domain S-box-containing protein